MARHFIVVAALTMFAAAGARADDGHHTAGPTASDWQGVYVGGHFGAAWGQSDWTANGAGGLLSDNGSLGLGNPFEFSPGTGSYFQGLQAGYNYELPSGVVLGAQADLSFPNLLAGTQTIAVAGIDIANYEQQVLFSGTLRGRLGYAFGPLLVYGTGGYALAQDEITRTQVAGMAIGGTATPGTEEARRSFRSGWVAGAGVETKVGGNWSANLEYLFTDLGSHSVTFPNGAQTFNSDITFQNVRVGLNYRLPGIGDDASLVRPKFAAPSSSDWSVHAQTTYLIQMDPDFRSPYVGPHSLIPGQQRETWDATFYLGLRLWQGAELWIDPEIDQGFGLSDTFGVAGFPSGEAYKLGEAVPYARVPRYFVRDTINLGGASEKIDGAANKLSGSQTADRLVLTLGKFAITDVFDTNRYAHDRVWIG